MAENYYIAFKLQLYHGYFLNEGLSEFNDMSSANKEKALSRYNFSECMEIVPDQKTRNLIRNQRCMYKTGADQVAFFTSVVAGTLHPTIPLSGEECFTFYLRRKSEYFEQFTDLTLEKERIHLFTNRQPDDMDNAVPLIHLNSDLSCVDDSYRLTVEDTAVVLADVPLQDRIGLVGIIRIYSASSTATHSLLSAANTLQATCPVFRIHFANRYTYWKYIRLSDSFEIATNSQKPLTKRGYIEIDPNVDFDAPPPAAFDYTYPNAGLGTLEVDPPNIYSVIFI